MTGTTAAAGAALAALPWALVPLAIGRRARTTRTLGDFPEVVCAASPPLVSVIVPARDEAHNIERCIRSILATAYPRVEVIIVDDHSADGTADAARRIARGDGRVRIVAAPALPAGWFGKQWACTVGAAAANGELLCFTDADTIHASDLLARSVNALTQLGAALFTVAGHQQLGSLWERLVQPQVFAMIIARYGSPDRVNRSPRVHDKIANGQFILVQRRVYEALGGHAAVRHKVAEDMALAQRWFAEGHRVWIVTGFEQLTTRMYTSLREVVSGWRKNIYAASIDALPEVRGRRAAHPLLLLSAPVIALAPPAALLTVLASRGSAALVLWGALATAAELFWWGVLYRAMGECPAYAAGFPLGSVVLGYIICSAARRGRRVAWKRREYVSA